MTLNYDTLSNESVLLDKICRICKVVENSRQYLL